MKKFIVFIVLLLFNMSAVAEKSVRLKVTATILPRHCEYPKRCDPVKRFMPTRVFVEEGVVRYRGTPPTVSEKDGVMTVIF